MGPHLGSLAAWRDRPELEGFAEPGAAHITGGGCVELESTTAALVALTAAIAGFPTVAAAGA
jgi:hypothetical protein